MRPSWALLALTILLAGCTGAAKGNVAVTSLGPTDTVSTTGPPPTATLTGDPVQVESVLNRTPHAIVDGPTTLRLDFGNATGNAYRLYASLVYLRYPFHAGVVHATGSPSFLALAPLGVGRSFPPCGEASKDVHYYFRSRDGDGDFRNLTVDYAAGWYHLLALAHQAGSFTITFKSTRELAVRDVPLVNPYVTGNFTSAFGTTNPKIDFQPVGPWFAVATHRLPPEGVDGGRDQTVTVGGCRTAHRGPDPMSPVFINIVTLSLDAAGTGTGPVHVEALYKPTVAAYVPDSTPLDVAWFSVRSEPTS